jgi:hypothetical protein
MPTSTHQTYVDTLVRLFGLSAAEGVLQHEPFSSALDELCGLDSAEGDETVMTPERRRRLLRALVTYTLGTAGVPAFPPALRKVLLAWTTSAASIGWPS